MSRKIRVIDLFSGCGGLGLGFSKAGFDVVASFDNWDPAIKIHQANEHVLLHPIYKQDLSVVPEDLSVFSQYLPDMVIGGPPCQDFSSAGKRDETLGRADLTVVFSNIVTALGTKWFVMENVERAVKSRAYKQAIKNFVDAGYGLSLAILDASYYRVPQRRMRMFLFGELGGRDGALLPLLEERKTENRMSLRDYFGESLGVEHYYRHPRSYKRRAVFSIDEPSPTIRGVNRPVPNGYTGHPGDSTKVTKDLRPLTTKERSLVQTFPRDFSFDGVTKTDLEQMIGNAVPVNLAREVAGAALAHIQSHGQAEPAREMQLSFYYK
ncbi:MAG TPA: DNA cytosine methyltransferase [Anaerolineales bacterium]|nr:DNA cytosine methyltransferase [Anaerolineales bacterium]HRQ91908.1 DNA cytosine methyltransferase [Anaerolineales bacterium]